MAKYSVRKTSMSGQSILSDEKGMNGVSVQLPTNVANLFAAAPEMLELLEEMLHNNHISDDYSDKVYGLIKKAGSNYKV